MPIWRIDEVSSTCSTHVNPSTPIGYVHSEVRAALCEIEVWTPDDTFPTTERERVSWLPEGSGEELVLELGELFRPI